MPVLKMYIQGKLVKELEISFEGLATKEERIDHVEGLVRWIKNKSQVTSSHNYEILIEGVQSAGNNMINLDKEEVINDVEQTSVNRKPFKNIQRKEYDVESDEKQPIIRPKAEYSNKDWFSEYE